MVINFIKSKAFPILFILIALLSISNVYYYVSSVNKENKIIQLNDKVDDLQFDISILENNYQTLEKTCTAERQALEYMLDAQENARQMEKDTLEELENVKQIEKPNKASVNNLSDRLPSDLSRVLNNHCDKVRGQACKSP